MQTNIYSTNKTPHYQESVRSLRLQAPPSWNFGFSGFLTFPASSCVNQLLGVTVQNSQSRFSFDSSCGLKSKRSRLDNYHVPVPHKGEFFFATALKTFSQQGSFYLPLFLYLMFNNIVVGRCGHGLSLCAPDVH